MEKAVCADMNVYFQTQTLLMEVTNDDVLNEICLSIYIFEMWKI